MKNGAKLRSKKTKISNLIVKRMILFTLIVFALFFIIYAMDFLVIYKKYGAKLSEGLFTNLYRMPVPLEALLIVFVSAWLVGLILIAWYNWGQHEKHRSQPISNSSARTKAHLQKTIQKRYQVQFWVSMSLYTLVMAIIAFMLFLVEKSRYWYAEDLLYPFLKALKELSPFAAIALWVGGAAILLFRQWKKSASDTVGLIDSIEQMQAEEEYIDISVPQNLIEIKPVLQEILDRSQKSRQAAKEAEQRKNELIAYLAHDLRTPLTSVIGYLSLLAEEPDMPREKKDQYHKIALDKAVRLESLISQFFEISQYNLNEMVLEKKLFDLHLLIMQLTDEFYPLLESQNKTITLEVPENLWLEGDAGKLARVFNNILRNALSYSKPGSEIVLQVSQNKTQVLISVTNQGRTIPAERLDSIFNKFFRLDGARTSDTGGAGLGLAIAQEIVLLHDGTISATSNDGETVFTVCLPSLQLDPVDVHRSTINI